VLHFLGDRPRVAAGALETVMRQTSINAASAAFLCVVAGCAESSSAPEPARPPTKKHTAPEAELPSVEKVLGMLPGKTCGMQEHEQWVSSMVALGDSAFPAYEAILADPNSRPGDFMEVCYILSRLTTDRRRFVFVLVQRLSDPDALLSTEVVVRKVMAHDMAGPTGEQPTLFDRVLRSAEAVTDARSAIRTSAVQLLGAIGNERDTTSIMPFLSDDDAGVRYATAKSLARIGAQRDLEAMDAWLKNGKHPNDGDYMIHVKKCRDELEKRLKENPLPKGIIN
jgi:hypothetical protein